MEVLLENSLMTSFIRKSASSGSYASVPKGSCAGCMDGECGGRAGVGVSFTNRVRKGHCKREPSGS